MANATVSHSNGVCTITMPANAQSIVLIPKVSGNAEYLNYCSWSNVSDPGSPVALGEWSGHLQDLSIVSNPYNLINTVTKIGSMTSDTEPSVTGLSETNLTFTHRVNENSPILGDDLKVTVTNVTDDITVISILAEDLGDHNFLDFQMTVIIHDN